MNSNNSIYNEYDVLHELKHYLPSQAPLKDFIHQNPLLAFQNLKFNDGIRQASKIFGYFISLQLEDYRSLYISTRIREDVLKRIIVEKKGIEHVNEWMNNVLGKKYDTSITSRIGSLRSNWKKKYRIDLDLLVHPLLFRILCSYLDQGISMWSFPVDHKGFLASIKEIEGNSFTSFFKRKRAKELLLKGNCEIEDLLKILVGDQSLYKQYLFDQQFAHQGWSGMVSTIEHQPQSLLNPKKISIHDLIIFELLLEIDALDFKFGEDWLPIGNKLKIRPIALFDIVPETELDEVLFIWQEAFEWSYYDQVLAAIQLQKKREETEPFHKSFQVFTCIDDRELSFRRYLERIDSECETFATPGFFGVEFYFQPENGKFYAKCCPASISPKYLIKETETQKKGRKKLIFLNYLIHSSEVG